MDYRSLPRISNSDLTEFKRFIFGEKHFKPVSAFAFGSTLHELILEPHKPIQAPDTVDLSLCTMLARVARNDRFLSWALQFSAKESMQLWDDPVTGLALKARLDIVHKKQLVVDIKSTSCKSYNDFLDSCNRYEYDRQAAFYLDSIGAKRFVFVAVQKIAPYNVWTVAHHTAGPFVEAGRKKYRALLREWKRRNDRGESFIPTSWSTQPHALCC